MPKHECLREFGSPPEMYRPVPFWSWNETMEPEEVRRQVDMIAGAGWGGIFIHSRIGPLYLEVNTFQVAGRHFPAGLQTVSTLSLNSVNQ